MLAAIVRIFSPFVISFPFFYGFFCMRRMTKSLPLFFDFLICFRWDVNAALDYARAITVPDPRWALSVCFALFFRHSSSGFVPPTILLERE